VAELNSNSLETVVNELKLDSTHDRAVVNLSVPEQSTQVDQACAIAVELDGVGGPNNALTHTMGTLETAIETVDAFVPRSLSPLEARVREVTDGFNFNALMAGSHTTVAGQSADKGAPHEPSQTGAPLEAAATAVIAEVSGLPRNTSRRIRAFVVVAMAMIGLAAIYTAVAGRAPKSTATPKSMHSELTLPKRETHVSQLAPQQRTGKPTATSTSRTPHAPNARTRRTLQPRRENRRSSDLHTEDRGFDRDVNRLLNGLQ
jgi:hypothetical protein